MAAYKTFSLLLVLMVIGCSADPVISNSPAQEKLNFVNIEHGWPLPDMPQELDVTGDSELVMQLPACKAMGGVCAATIDCAEEYVHEATDLCGDQSKVSCCLTRSTTGKHIVQLSSCAAMGSICAWDEDCPKEDKHSNPLLCGEQSDVSCCRIQEVRKRTSPSLATFRTMNVGKRTAPADGPRTSSIMQHESCSATGGFCQHNADCSPGDRYSLTELCNNQPDISCCRKLPARMTPCESRGGECVGASVCQNAPTDGNGECPSNLVCCIWTRNLNP